jgi:hypothetical protein
MLDFETAIQILALIFGMIFSSFGLAFLIDWLFSFHEPEDEE